MDSVKRVKLFGDWDKSSMEMVDLLRSRTQNMVGNFYGDIEFVNEGYTHAVVFNYPREEILCPPKNVVGLILEPPEILDALYPGRKRGDIDGVGRMYAFCEGLEYPTALGLGFATANPDTSNVWPHEKKKRCMMICSNKIITSWHHKRWEIFRSLLESDMEIDFYGRGMNIPDPRCKGEIPSYGKGEIIRQYKMCIDFENAPTAITDKFFDTVLSNTFPITNASRLRDLVDEQAFLYVDFNLPTRLITTAIEDFLEIGEDEIIKHTPALMEAKQQIMMGNLNLTHWIWERLSECE